MSDKTIRRVHQAMRDDIGDLMTQRPLPNPHLDQLDPFLFLNHHGPQTYPPYNHGLPFGPHPHRGFETVTFIVAGMLTHKDSAGHESVIHAGACSMCQRHNIFAFFRNDILGRNRANSGRNL